MRRRSWLAVVLSLPWLAACWLATDWDEFTSSTKTPRPDAAAMQQRDGAPASAGEGGVIVPGDSGAEGGPRPPTYGDIVMVDHPVGYWPFDEPAGSALATEKVTGKTATANKEHFTFGLGGVAATALGSDGKGALSFGDMLDVVANEPFTIEAWIKPQFDAGKVFYEYLNKRADGNNGIVAYVRREKDGDTVQIEQTFSGGGRGVDRALTTLDRFNHVVFVYDPAKTGLRCWVNGQHGDKGYADPGGPTDNPQTLYIASGVKGMIDEVAVYDYALADDRILAHFNAGKP